MSESKLEKDTQSVSAEHRAFLDVQLPSNDVSPKRIGDDLEQEATVARDIRRFKTGLTHTALTTVSLLAAGYFCVATWKQAEPHSERKLTFGILSFVLLCTALLCLIPVYLIYRRPKRAQQDASDPLADWLESGVATTCATACLLVMGIFSIQEWKKAEPHSERKLVFGIFSIALPCTALLNLCMIYRMVSRAQQSASGPLATVVMIVSLSTMCAVPIIEWKNKSLVATSSTIACLFVMGRLFIREWKKAKPHSGRKLTFGVLSFLCAAWLCLIPVYMIYQRLSRA